MATGFICLGSINGQPIYISSEGVAAPQAAAYTPFVPAAATGLICIGSVNGQAVFAQSAHQAASVQGNAFAPASTGPGAFGPFSASVAPSATGLVCIGSINGQAVFTTLQNTAPAATTPGYVGNGSATPMGTCH